MAKILVVDDERLLVKGLKRSLENEGYEVAVAYDGAEALSLVRRMTLDLVLLDIMLPQVDGLEVCRRIRQFSNVPIIMLTARGDAVDKIVGLELGADDYLAKPFNTRELIARIRAILRRVPSARGGSGGGRSPCGLDEPGQASDREKPGRGSASTGVQLDDGLTGGAGTWGRPVAPDSLSPGDHLNAPEGLGRGIQEVQPGAGLPEQVIKAGGLEINVPRQSVRRDGRTVELTAREFDLLLTLARHPGRIFTRDILLEQVWGSRYFGEPRVVDVYIRRLRQKIEPDTNNPRWIMTRWGAGYYFAEDYSGDYL
ncbi:response regulator transcription factor [Desulfoscipio gibsoniae]|uniref:Stage 0 sporulation protein A homolog n=1 Tax=Desulfoscipio gibsoniae DSM 7213 TaxID=767817 RepID=R4KM11_9FIRM|nr:response regulator with CheY-like receiver domain and winged-helix DNA-binding domain [Desulfoscipio gibsoniae DSM 7213]